MMRSGLTEERIIEILKATPGHLRVQDLCRKDGALWSAG
jgi:hypothetical protein